MQAYTESVMHELVGMGYEIDLVYFDQDSHTPFKPMSSDHVSLYKLSEYNTIELVNVIRSMAPEIVYISGWQSIKYLICAFLLRLKHTKVVVGFDDQWHGTLKQQVGRVLAGLGVFKLFFSHAWVCGPYQYEYARKFGFKKEDIVFDLLTGDVPLFSSLSNDRSKSGDKIFIYVGRMSEEKGIFTLLDAWLKFRKHKNDWRLVMIGATEQTRQLMAPIYASK